MFSGVCLILRPELLQRCGGFDKGLPFVEFNELDLCLRLQALGYRLVVSTEAVLIHHESKSQDAKSSATANPALKRR